MNTNKKNNSSIFLPLLIAGLLFSMLANVSGVYAQRNKSANDSQHSDANTAVNTDHNWKVYKLALRYNDFQVAISALYNILATNPEDTGVKDSLTTLYFMAGMNAQAIVLGEDLLKNTPNSSKFLEMTAIAYRNLGYLKDAVSKYERLYAVSKRPYDLYQLAIVEYSLKRFEESATHLNMLIADPKSAEEKITIELDQRQSQKVVLAAAAYNVLGALHLELNKADAARQYFQKATESDATFELPKNNLIEMDKKKK